MMTMQDERLAVIPVRLVGPDGEPVQLPLPRALPSRKSRLTVTLRTLVLAAGTVADLAPMDPLRDQIIVEALDSDVVVCHNLGQAQDPANLVVGLTSPAGLVVQASDTAPFPIPGTDRLWCIAPAAARLAVCIVRRTSAEPDV